MRATPAGRRPGPFVLPARLLLLVTGLLSIALGSFNLGHELHSTNVDLIYVVVAGLVGILWLVTLLLAWRGSRAGTFVAGLIGFVEFAVIAATHFVTAPWAIDIYAKHEGLAVAAVLIALGTFIVWYSFVTLHIVAGTPVSAIASGSGTVWAVIALGTATLAAASFLAALTFLTFDVVRRVQSRGAEPAPATGRASR